MRKKLRKVAVYSFFDHTHIEANLERMARKGWMLETMGNYLWTYRRIEPKGLHFTVSYAPKASAFDPDLTEEQREFIDFCERTLWRFVAANAQLQVFCNEQRDPVPIHTDPILELETLHKAAKRSYIPSYCVLLALALIQLGLLAAGMIRDPIRQLASIAQGAGIFDWLALAVWIVCELGAYFLWRKRALKAAERGEFLATPNLTRFQHIILALVLLDAAYLLLSLVFSNDMLLLVCLLAAWAYFAVVAAGVNLTKNLLKRKGASRGVNRAVTIAVDVVLAFGGMALLIFFIIRAGESGRFDDAIKARASIPLVVEDLTDTGVSAEWYIRQQTDRSSPLLAQYELHQYRDWHNADADGVALPGIDYTITDVKAAFLFDFCRNKLLHAYDPDEQDIQFGFVGDYQPVDAAPWGAEEAYRLYWRENDGALNHWLLRYGRRFVKLGLDWEPTAEQMAIIGEKLGK